MKDILYEQTFWERTNNLIKKKNITQRSLSLLCGFAERRIESLSSYNRLPTIFECYKMSTNLNVPVEYLITGENPEGWKPPSRIAEIVSVLETLSNDDLAVVLKMINGLKK